MNLQPFVSCISTELIVLWEIILYRCHNCSQLIDIAETVESFCILISKRLLFGGSVWGNKCDSADSAKLIQTSATATAILFFFTF